MLPHRPVVHELPCVLPIPQLTQAVHEKSFAVNLWPLATEALAQEVLEAVYRLQRLLALGSRDMMGSHRPPSAAPKGSGERGSAALRWRAPNRRHFAPGAKRHPLGVSTTCLLGRN